MEVTGPAGILCETTKSPHCLSNYRPRRPQQCSYNRRMQKQRGHSATETPKMFSQWRSLSADTSCWLKWNHLKQPGVPSIFKCVCSRQIRHGCLCALALSFDTLRHRSCVTTDATKSQRFFIGYANNDKNCTALGILLGWDVFRDNIRRLWRFKQFFLYLQNHRKQSDILHKALWW